MIVFTDKITTSIANNILSFPLISGGVNPKEILQESEHIILAIDNSSNKLIGYILLTSAIDCLPPEIQYLVVLKEYEGKGVGSGLLKKMIQYVRNTGNKRIAVYAINDSKPFFEKHGFIGKNQNLELIL